MCINTSSHWELHTASLVSQTLKLHTAEGHLSWKTALSINRLTRLSNHLSSLPSLLISRAIDIVSVLRRFPWKTVTACSLLLLTLSSYGSFSFILKKSDPATCRHKIFGGPLWHPTPVLLPGNPMDGGAWWAAVHGVAKSRTRLSDFTFTFHFHELGKEMATHPSVLAWRIPGMGEPGRLPSMGLHRVGHDWSESTAVWPFV